MRVGMIALSAIMSALWIFGLLDQLHSAHATMRYLALSTRSEVDACEYPDSRKVGIYAGKGASGGLRKMFRAETTVDYYDREQV